MIASRHDDLTVTFATFANGELAIDQIAQVARYTAPHNDAEACYLASQATVIQLRSALSRHQPAWHPTTGSDTHDDDAKPRDDAKAGDDAKPGDDPEPQDGTGTADVGDDAGQANVAAEDPGVVTMWFDDDGRYQFHAECPADIGALIDTPLREARDALINAGKTNVTWIAALAEVCNRSLGSIRSTSRADKYGVYIHLDVTTETPITTDHETDDGGEPDVPSDQVDVPSDQVEAGARVVAQPVAPTRPAAPNRLSRSTWATNHPPARLLPAWLNAGPGLTDPIRDHLCCDTIVRPVYYHGGKPVNLGRATRTVRNDLRPLILERDRCCRYPGCNSAAHLEVHHLIHWIKGGPTDTFNLAALCPENHRGTHVGAYTAIGNADLQDGTVWRQRNGAIIPAAGTRSHQPARYPNPHRDTPTTTPPAKRSAPNTGNSTIHQKNDNASSPKPPPAQAPGPRTTTELASHRESDPRHCRFTRAGASALPANGVTSPNDGCRRLR